MKRFLFIASLFVLICMHVRGDAAGTEPEDRHVGVENRISNLIDQMTLDEKIGMVAGRDVWSTLSIDRLGIPTMRVTDGPHGVREGKATCFPTGIGMAATWNPELIFRVGMALGEETRAKEVDILLGPCINICRTPLNGRNFEAFGEDPYLVSCMGVAYVEGVQHVGIGTSTKHYVANNQERDRFTVDVQVSERALREIYLPAFKAAVQEADTKTVMTAHNKINGAYGSANDYLLNDILKDEWGFDGFTVSDWGGVHDAVQAATCGHDLEMPGPGVQFADPLKQAIEEGDVSEDIIDDKVRRLLRVAFWLEQQKKKHRNGGALNTPEHKALARAVAREAITLVKNQGGLLPLSDTIKSLAVIGPNAATARVGGGGSSVVDPPEIITPLEALRLRAGDDVAIYHATGCVMPGETDPIPASALFTPDGCGERQGLLGEYFDNPRFEGEPVLSRVDPVIDFVWDSPVAGIGGDHFSVRWTGTLMVPKDGEYSIGILSDDGSRLYLDNELVIDNWGDHAAKEKDLRILLKEGESHSLRVEYYEGTGGAVMRLGWSVHEALVREAAKVASSCDVAVVVIGLSSKDEGEDVDRISMELPGLQDELIQAVAQANTNAIVLFIGGSPVVMESWFDEVPAILCAWYPGQEGGYALAEILFGDVNPSGKMPVTFPRRLADSPSFNNYPGTDGAVEYEEGLYVGYRHFDTHNIPPQIAFGHGLSYTTFDYSNLEIDVSNLVVSVDIWNAGKRAGKEVVQLYVRDFASSLDRPMQELKRFDKVCLASGESKTVRFKLGRNDLSFYDPQEKGWVAEPGEFEIRIGSSSRDIRQCGTFTYKPEK